MFYHRLGGPTLLLREGGGEEVGLVSLEAGFFLVEILTEEAVGLIEIEVQVVVGEALGGFGVGATRLSGNGVGAGEMCLMP